MKHNNRTKGLCSKCHKPLEINRFRKQSYCKTCHAEYMKANRPKHSELSEEQKLKANARAYLHVYIKRGKIVKQSCETCGCDNLSLIEGHHHDFTKPLEVKWLCRQCHLNLHSVNKM